MACWGSMPNSMTFKKVWTIDWHCTSPPGVPKGINTLPSFIASAGLGVNLGRLPGCSDAGWSASSQLWEPLEDRMNPRPLAIGALPKLSLGVAEKALPHRSTTET